MSEYIPLERRVLSANDLYDLNRIINKLNEAGHSHMGAKLSEVRDYAFTEDGDCQIENWVDPELDQYRSEYRNGGQW